MTAMQSTPDSVEILDRAGARQWKDKDGVWIISLPRKNDRQMVQWAIRDLAAAAGVEPCVLWVRREK